MNSFNKSKIPIKFIFIVVYSLLCTNCKKLVDVSPPNTEITGTSAYNSNSTAAAVMTGLYINISGLSFPAVNLLAVSRLSGLSADELTLYNGITDNESYYYSNSLFSPVPSAAAASGGGYELWSPLYSNIFTCNSAIEGAQNSTALTGNVRNQIIGEAKFIRAYCYFYLVNLFGDVPLSLVTDYKVTGNLSRTPKDTVYNQIITDLKDAESLLSENYLQADMQTATMERVRPTKWAAAALLARVYLFNNDFTNAETEASTVIQSSGSLFVLTSLNDAFLANSSEAIWQLQPVIANSNSQDGALFVLPSFGPSQGNPVYLSNFLMQAFEVNDMRRQNWIDSVIVGSDTFYFPYKYKLGLNTAPGSEYQMMLRLAEVYLIRAEARAEKGDIQNAEIDLNIVRNRAGLPDVSLNDKVTLVDTILHERRVELFTEMGARWLDLKRSGTIDPVMNVVTPVKAGIQWKTFQQLYPVPNSDIILDHNLSQNPGY